jgi:hypothetical protein
LVFEKIVLKYEGNLHIILLHIIYHMIVVYSIGLYDNKAIWIVEHCLDSSTRAAVRTGKRISNLRMVTILFIVIFRTILVKDFELHLSPISY